MYKQNRETIVSYDDSVYSRIKTIRELITLGSKNKTLIKEALAIQHSNNIYQSVLNYVYSMSVMTLTPNNRQQFRTVRNILLTKKANCTGYVTMIGSLLSILNIPFTLRTTGMTYDYNGQKEYTHIYIIANGFTMDATVGQDPYGNATFDNRNINATFDHELGYSFKLDFHINMNTVLNGSHNAMNGISPELANAALENYKGSDGKIDFARATADIRRILDTGVYGINTIMTLVNQYINPCKRGCDIKYPFNSLKRRACKNECATNQLKQLSAQELQRLMNYTSAQTNILSNDKLFILAGAAAFLYFYTQD